MARPRSLVGLLAYLVALWVRRRPALLAIVLVPLVAIVLVSRGRTTESGQRGRSMATTQVTPPLQTAVLNDGYSVMEAVGDRHVVELDRNGTRRRRSAIPTVTETRSVGMAAGAGVVWLQSKKIRVAKIKGDGELGNPQIFGTSVRQMCHGLASNHQRWAVGWLEERDDRFWFVHGPTTRDKAADAGPELMTVAFALPTTKPLTWCAVTSANDYVALIYRLDNKTFVNMCSRKECGGLHTRAPIDPRDEVLDIACQRDGCVIALRTPSGDAHLVAFNLRGKATWTKKLPYAANDTPVQLAAAGDRAYIMSLMTNEGPAVERMLSKNGLTGRSWHGAQGLSAPAITWAYDHAMLAYWDGDSLGTDVFAMPR